MVFVRVPCISMENQSFKKQEGWQSSRIVRNLLKVLGNSPCATGSRPRLACLQFVTAHRVESGCEVGTDERVGPLVAQPTANNTGKNLQIAGNNVTSFACTPLIL